MVKDGFLLVMPVNVFGRLDPWRIRWCSASELRWQITMIMVSLIGIFPRYVFWLIEAITLRSGSERLAHLEKQTTPTMFRPFLRNTMTSW